MPSPRRRVPPPVSMSMTRRSAEEDINLVRDLFGAGWRHYIYGTREKPGAVAYARQLGDDQWAVFCLFSDRQAKDFPVATGAYITVPYTMDPVDPGLVVWYFSGMIHTTAKALIAVAAEPPDFKPMNLPDSLRLPKTRPVILRL